MQFTTPPFRSVRLAIIALLAVFVFSGQAVAASVQAPPSADTSLALPFGIGLGVGLLLACLLFDKLGARRSTATEPGDFPNLRISADRAEVREGGGCMMALFGSCFAAVGAFLLLGALLDASKAGSSRIIAAVFGIFPLFIGLAVAGLRNAIVMDRTTQSLSSVMRFLFIPLRQKSRTLADANHVRVLWESGTRDGRSGRHSNVRRTTPTYQISLAFAQGSDTHLNTSSSASDARRQAEHIARFLRLPLLDETETARQIRHVDELDQSVAQQPAALTADVPVVPAGCRVTSTETGRTVVLQFPPAPTEKPRVNLIFTAIACAIFARPIAKHLGLPSGYEMIFVSFVGVSALLYGLSYLTYRLRRNQFERITVSPDALTLELKTTFRSRRQSLPGSAIEEVLVNAKDLAEDRKRLDILEDITQNRLLKGLLGAFRRRHDAYAADQFAFREAIVARGDHGTLRFGQGLTHGEADYTRERILHALRTSS